MWPFHRPQPVSYKEYCDRYAAEIRRLNEDYVITQASNGRTTLVGSVFLRVAGNHPNIPINLSYRMF